MWGARPIAFVNATVLGGDGSVHETVRVRRGRVVALGLPPQRGDAIVDVERAVILPGLVNAHDHLELNSFARLKWRERYENVREWIADFQPRFAGDPQLAAARADTLHDRLWVGGLKNLLAGVTTVCHHNPLHAPLKRRFPVRVLRRFGLSHSLHVDGASVADVYRRTPARWPWIIHAAEGVDAEARAEVATLASLGCLGPNTVIVHGVAIDGDDAARIIAAGGGLVWCPSSNHFLFARTTDVGPFDRARRLALGTDSRLSGERDLLDELRVAASTRQLSAERLVQAVTSDAAALLRAGDAGRLAPGSPADLVVLRRVAEDPFASVVSSTRRDVRLTMCGGAPLVGDVDLRPVFDATRQPFAEVRIDGSMRLLARWIARRVQTMRLTEPGLEQAA